MKITLLEIKKLVKQIINEATLENDQNYYNEAQGFYYKMIELIKNGQIYVTSPTLQMFLGNFIDRKYDDLGILFVDSLPYTDASALLTGFDDGTFAMKLPTLKNGNNDPLLGIDKSEFIHEFIHYLDYKRTNNKSFKERRTYSDDYNLPDEFNAYYQQTAGALVTKLTTNKEFLETVRENLPSYPEFYDWVISKLFHQGFIKNISDVNKIKLKKRLYNIYREIVEVKKHNTPTYPKQYKK